MWLLISWMRYAPPCETNNVVNIIAQRSRFYHQSKAGGRILAIQETLIYLGFLLGTVALKQHFNGKRIFAGSACHPEAGIPIRTRLLCVIMLALLGVPDPRPVGKKSAGKRYPNPNTGRRSSTVRGDYCTADCAGFMPRAILCAASTSQPALPRDMY